MKRATQGKLSGDFWGGLAAMLVALPSAIAFGVTIYSPLGGVFAAQGAVAGILGVTALGLLAPALGGTKRLITAPCAPAAAVLSGFVIEHLNTGHGFESALLMLSLLGLIAGLMQVGFGSIGLGRLIKYMPYPVVSGYLSGVGLYIIASQVPKLLGVPKELHFWDALAAVARWQWEGIAVGGVTMAVMVLAPAATKRVPAAILALAAGLVAYFGIAQLDGAMLHLQNNTLVVGPLGGGGTDGLLEALAARWSALKGVDLAGLEALLMPALTLAVLLSIDTLKTCVVLDALTRTRHDSNRELIGQGVGNIASALIGGIPGAGTMGATLVNLSSGATSQRSGMIEGALALVAFLLLSAWIAWVPVAALAGILIVIGCRMVDLHTLAYLKSRHTVLDFVVILAVVIVALTVSLIAASATGIVLAVLLFMREQIGGSVIRRKAYGDQTFSKRIRRQAEMDILAKRGQRSVIIELQGSLFFGTTDQLYTELEHQLKRRPYRHYIILDMKRVQSVDVTATHMLDQVQGMLAARKGFLIFSQIPRTLPSGRDVQKYFDEVGLVHPDNPVKVFNELDDAVEWVEDRLLAEAAMPRAEENLLTLDEIEIFAGRKPETLTALEACMVERSCKAGETVFSRGDRGDELFLIRKGEVRILLPTENHQVHHISTFGRGSFFGEMTFLDGHARSATAIAFTDTHLYVLSRAGFDQLSEDHRRLALNLLEGLARVLAARLRYADAEIHSLS